MWDATQLALLREAGIAGNSTSAGLTALRSANYATPGLYAHAFFSLSIGLERFMKIIFILDHIIKSGSGPTDKDLRALGHDLDQMFEKVLEIAKLQGFKVGPTIIVEGGIEMAALQFLGRFARTTRYYNIDFVAKSPRVSTSVDPIEDWYTNVGGMILKKHLTKKQQDKIAALAQRSQDAYGHITHVAHTAEDGTPITTVYDAVYHSGVSEVVRRYGVLYVAKLCRCLYCILFDAVYRCVKSGIAVPFLYELFFPFMNSDQLFLSRKTFAPQSQ